MTTFQRITNLNSNGQASVDIFKDYPSDPPSKEYLVALDVFVNSSLRAKEIFILGGAIKQLQRLGLLTYCKNNFLDSWMGYWWKLTEKESIRPEYLVELCELAEIPEDVWMIQSYFGAGFFKRYEQAKNKYRRSLQANESP